MSLVRQSEDSEESESRQPGLGNTPHCRGGAEPRREPSSRSFTLSPHRGAQCRPALSALDLLRHINMLGLFSAGKSNEVRIKLCIGNKLPCGLVQSCKNCVLVKNLIPA